MRLGRSFTFIGEDGLPSADGFVAQAIGFLWDYVEREAQTAHARRDSSPTLFAL